MLAIELTPEPMDSSVSGASTADAEYVLGMLKPMTRPSTAPTAHQTSKVFLLFQSLEISSMMSISCSSCRKS